MYKMHFSYSSDKFIFLLKLWNNLFYEFTRQYIYTFVTKKYIHYAGIFSYYVRKTIFRNSKYECDDRTRSDIAKAVIAHNRGLESVLLRTHIYRPLQYRHLIQSSFVLVDLSRRYRTTTHSHMLSSFCLLSLL